MPVLSGCAKDDSSRRSETDIAITVAQAESGGELVLIQGGQFVMGDAGGAADETPHDVYVDAFYIDRHPVSQSLFEGVMGVNPSKRKGSDNPVERVQWTAAARFCNKCSELEGLTPCYDLATWECDSEASGYRLPTEAEWEYACRAGSQSKYSFGDDASQLARHAWCKPHSLGRTWPVGEKLPNAWGLHDMHGNVWEWCNDFYSDSYYSQSPRENPRGPDGGKKRVLRGGAWSSTAGACRAAHRFSEFQVFTDACFGSDSYGFRRVRNGKSTPAEEPSLAELRPDRAAETKQPVVAQPVPSETPPPVIAADGKIDPERLQGTIVFVSDRGGPLDIWKMNANGRNLKQVTADAHADADPRFSPSGDRIMYTSAREGFPHVWMMNADGSNPQHVTEGSQAAWSPDGKSIVLIRDDQAHIRELASGDERRVTPEQWRRCGVPAWRPDGKQVAVASRHLERIGIFLLSTDGILNQQLKTEDACCTPQWSADGGQIVFQTDKGHIHLLYTEDGTEEQVTFGADIQHDARFSPDGSMIVFCRAPSEDGPWQIWVTDLGSDDLESIPITNEGSNRLPDWHQSAD
ncbi:MAG: SUMF1/EgtB/PvdO family nonheme iron enzyme [Pirellulaceae bacterium]|nr:SUMF1/EgtB/PvdO family nonheme iron enzyme [Pirellulaceae bacterium]MDP7017339.1 SUMF1/EgtB/PvdO family nonheme iron enzyme [Pirellulaceae bacterium]